MNKTGLLLIVFSWILISPGFSQSSFPISDPVFTDSIIPKIEILIDQDSLQAIYDDVTSYHEYPATFIFHAGTIVDTVKSVGFRLRGNTSRYSPKKSFKISFNTFNPGGKYYGLEKMNINGEHNDPSVIRAKLCWDVLRKFEIPAPRSNHVELYINGNYFGLYINVEHIDEEFVLSRFGNNGGNLYKCLWPADLHFFSSNPDDYKITQGDRRAYDLRTNVEWDNYNDLYQFIYILNTAPKENLPCELEKVFNVADFLKILAFDVVSGNWDGYSYNKNNFYLYQNTSTGKFEYILYDLDNTLGIDWIGRDWGIRNIYDWAKHGEYRPLHNRILEIQQYKDQFSFYVNQLVTEIMDTSSFFPRIDSIHAMISASLTSDPFYSLNYGYTLENFHQSYVQPLWGHVPYGLKPYINTRIEAAKDQLELNGIVPVIKYIKSNHPRLGEFPLVSAFVKDDDPLSAVELMYSINDGPDEIIDMYDNGLNPDLVADDNVYTVSLDPVSSDSRIKYQVKVNDQGGTGELIKPCQPVEIHVFETINPDLVINEFMAGNDQAIADEFGEYDDWVEIYNKDHNAVWMGDKYLSDDLQNPCRWLLPDSILDPGGFILIWADGQNGQGPAHTNFKLKKSGEEIGIFESPQRGSTNIDHLVFGAQLDDFSYGRSTDGGSEWIVFSSSTPGFSNLLTAIPVSGQVESPLLVYPNPANNGMIYFNKLISFRLYDLSGRLFMGKSNVRQFNTGGILPGIYLLRSEKGEIVKIIIQ